MFFCKKLVLLGLAAAGALAVTNAVWSGSVTTMWKKARVCVERQISPEFEIERIRDQIAKLTPDMNKHIEKIAEVTVDCASLNRKIEFVQGELEKRQKDILVLTEKVEKGIIPVSFTPNSLKDRLARELKSYKTCERDLGNKQKMLDSKQKALEAARNQLRAIQESRQTLEVELARMEADLATVRAEQDASKILIVDNDSRLGKIKADMENLQNLINRERVKLDLTGQFSDKPLTEESNADASKDIAAEVRQYFGAKTESAKKAD